MSIYFFRIKYYILFLARVLGSRICVVFSLLVSSYFIFIFNLSLFDPLFYQSLSAGTHLFCVYGDNWFQSVRYTLRCLVAVPQDTDCVETIKNSEEKLAIKKKELEKFQSEFCEIKKKYDAAKERLETDVKEITEFIQVQTEISLSSCTHK